MSSQRYIKTNNLRFSWMECWHLGRRPFPRLILFGAKLFGIRMNLAAGIPLADTARDYVVPPEEVPQELRDAMAPILTQLEQLGFHSAQFSMAKENLVRGVTAVNAILIHSSGQMLAAVAQAKSTLLQPPILKSHVTFETPLADGSAIVTTTASREMDPMPWDQIQYLRWSPLPAAFEQHRYKIAKSQPTAQLRLLRTPDELWAYQEEQHQRTVAKRLERGVWVLMNNQEVESLRAVRGTQPPPLPGDMDGAVLAELEKLQLPSRGWGNAALLFALSLMLFVALGAIQWRWEFALMLVPVLLFHELGHYFTMRMFRYQNLRIFFIPFFGAAVSGLQLNAPGWKQAIVALAGPVPGVLAGWGLQIIGAQTGSFWLEKLGRLCVFVNAFNLLPLMPLDGGRVLDSLLYVRNRWLEALALLVAALGMMAISHFGFGRLLFYLGLLMLFGLPHTWRVARVSGQLRAKGFATDPEHVKTISREAAQAILAETRAATQRPMPPKAIAQTVMAVYRRLHTKPPGWFGTLSILVIYLGALMLATALSLGSLRTRWEMQRLVRQLDKTLELTLSYDCANPGSTIPPTIELSSNRSTIVAVFANTPVAAAAFQRVSTNYGPGELATLFGQSVFVSSEDVGEPKSRQLLSGFSTKLLSHTPKSGHSIAFHMRARMPTEAEAQIVSTELEQYFALPEAFNVDPPWAEEDGIDTAEANRLRKARYTYRKLELAASEAFSDPKVQELNDEMLRSAQSGGRSNSLLLVKRQKELVSNRTRELQQALLNRPDPEFDHSVAAIYFKRPDDRATPEQRRAWNQEMGRSLGGSSASPLQGRALVQQEGQSVTVWGMVFRNLQAGAPALASYFCRHGATGLEYDFSPISSEEE